VSFSDHYFESGDLNVDNMRAAVGAATETLLPFANMPRELGVGDIIGSSGTARAIESVVTLAGWSEGGITRRSLASLKDRLLEVGQIKELTLPGLSDERRPVFPAGVAIMCGVFEALDIVFMHSSDCALREGVLLELIEHYQRNR
jgi:exopolyphosphatase/guanosine-5'-triphosphate,3'-diphosphate pyrophosphatase